MARKFSIYRERNNHTSILASFLVIAGGIAAMTLLGSIGTNDPLTTAIFALCLFGPVAILPIRAMMPAKRPAYRQPEPSPGLLTRLGSLFYRKPREEKLEIKPWKRRQTGFVHTPPGHDADSVFHRETKRV